MRPVPDWREVVSHSLSFWILVASALAMLVPELWYGWTGQDYDPYLMWRIGMYLLIAGIAGRLLEQPRSRWVERLRVVAVVAIVIIAAFVIPVRAQPASEQATLDVAVPLTAQHEGLRLVAYKPFSWDRPTICYGETNGVTMGMTATKAQCEAMLRADLAERRTQLHRYYRPHVVENLLPATRDAAYLDTAYNCGVAAIGKSTAVSRLNDGNVAGGCEALTWWDKGGGRVIRGLFIRRREDMRLCMIGVEG